MEERDNNIMPQGNIYDEKTVPLGEQYPSAQNDTSVSHYGAMPDIHDPAMQNTDNVNGNVNNISVPQPDKIYGSDDNIGSQPQDSASLSSSRSAFLNEQPTASPEPADQAQEIYNSSASAENTINNNSCHNTANYYAGGPANNTSVPPQQTPPPQKPVYDKFMYEPIGFAGYDNRAHIPPEYPYNNITASNGEDTDELPDKPDDKTAIRLLSALIACCLLVSVIGIVYDVANSKQAMKRFKSSGSVVLYSEKKPESAKELEDYKDKNGRYTTEGVAKLVRPSIVEIYTYTDPAHKDLVGTGSGVVISKDGYIVTNAHVLEPNGYHTIQTLDEEDYSATIIGRDVKTDIAVIKVSAKDLTPAVLGDSDESVVGEQVVAIGNPANLTSTVTDGIISAINRKIRSDSTGFQMDCIQTNADISPGNSGGALVNMYGQVIGITSSKYVSSMVEGLGFAITINEAKPIIQELLDNGFIAGRFRIGITLIDMSNASKRTTIEEAIKMDLPENFKGVYIQSIDKDSDIAKTKLKEGDFITEIDGEKISTYDELYEAISGKFEAGDTVPAKCAHLEKSGISYYDIEFKLMEDTSGNY